MIAAQTQPLPTEPTAAGPAAIAADNGRAAAPAPETEPEEPPPTF